MTREFIWTTAFLSGWHRCGFNDDDLKRLEDALLADPKAGDVYNDIIASLNELIDMAEGKETGAVVHRRAVQEVEQFTPKQIKEVRQSAGMTQKTFAACIGVSVKSIEAWEGGRSRPDGPARRLIGLMKSRPRFAEEMGII